MYGIFFIGFFLPTVAQFFGIEKLYFDAPHSAWIRSLRYCGHFLELSGSESFRSSGISAADVCTIATGSGWSVAMAHTFAKPTVIECVAHHGWPSALFGCLELGVSVVSFVRMRGNIGKTRRMLLDAKVAHCPKAAAEGPTPQTLLGHVLRSAMRRR